MDKIIFNPNWNEMNVNAFLKLIENNEGYCPCKIGKDESNHCICKQFMDKKTDGLCYCGLYLKITAKED